MKGASVCLEHKAGLMEATGLARRASDFAALLPHFVGRLKQLTLETRVKGGRDVSSPVKRSSISQEPLPTAESHDFLSCRRPIAGASRGC